MKIDTAGMTAIEIEDRHHLDTAAAVVMKDQDHVPIHHTTNTVSIFT